MVFVRPNGTVRCFRRRGRSWQSIADFDNQRRGSLAIKTVEVYLNRGWNIISGYPNGRVFPSLRIAYLHGKAVAEGKGYKV